MLLYSCTHEYLIILHVVDQVVHCSLQSLLNWYALLYLPSELRWYQVGH
uniref:Uncharacterized protein n=1 Tax=Arundo donax TaxID=35708 RepID=A0A0A9FD50_ARUDO